MSKTLVNELDKLVEDSNIYNKDYQKTQKEINIEHTEKIENDTENIDYIVPKNISESIDSTNLIEDAIDFKIFEIEIESNSVRNGTPTVNAPIRKEVVQGEIYLAKSGAQLFNLDTITRKNFMNIDGTLIYNINAFYSDFITVIPSTIIKIKDASYDTRIIEFDKNKEYITGVKYTTGTIRTIQLSDATHYIIISDNTINNTYEKMIVYAEYMNKIDDIYTGNVINKLNLENNMLNKLSNYVQDTINVDKNGIVIYNKKVERLYITGNENITMKSDTYTNTDGTINRLFTVPVPSNRRYRLDRYVESEYFYFQTDNNRVKKNNNICQFNETFQLTTNQFETLEDFVEWVKGLYEDGTPLYIDYMVQPTQINLGKISQLSTTEGLNYFYTLSNIWTNTNVKYALDIKRYTDNQIDELKAMVLENS